MVGDHPIDIETGKRAGAMTAGVATGRISVSELRQAGADFVAEDCMQLINMLKNQNY